MRKHSILNFTCCGAAIVLSCLPGIWSMPLNVTQDELGFSTLEKQPRSSLMKRGIDVNAVCIPPYALAIENAKTEALDIVSYAIPQLQTLLAHLTSNPVPSIVGMNIVDRTVFQTYEAFFGQTYFGTDTVTNRNKNTVALERLRNTTRTAQNIQSALQNPGSVNIQIWCDDYFFWDSDANGFPGNGIVHFDSRRWNTDGIGEWAKVQTCKQSPGTSAYYYRPLSPLYGGEDIIVLCTTYFPGWASRYDSGNTVNTFHNVVPLVNNAFQMDYLWGYLPATLIHEFTHSVNIMNIDPTNPITPYRDQCLINQAAAYQWQCIRQLAQENAQFAATNSDTFSLFVTAIYFNLNDWSTGIAQNLGYFPLATS